MPIAFPLHMIKKKFLTYKNIFISHIMLERTEFTFDVNVTFDEWVEKFETRRPQPDQPKE